MGKPKLSPEDIKKLDPKDTKAIKDQVKEDRDAFKKKWGQP